MTSARHHSADRLARVRLSRASEPGDPRVTELVLAQGAEAALARLDHEARRGAGMPPGEVGAEEELRRAEARGIRFVTPEDQEWPATLDDLEHAPELNDLGGVPVGLWVRGPLRLAEAVERAVAIVGSRSATTYGADQASLLAAGVAEEGCTVISGAAFGIDQAAHRGALAVRGTTVAVLACGVDRAYPQAHEALLRYLAEHALVVSETPPGGAPLRFRFLSRNRLIAALGQGTVVVEAAIRSGALNTAGWTDGLSRALMALPGPVTSAASQGVHQLIRNRGATLVTTAAEVLEALAPIGEQLPLSLRAPARRRDLLATQLRQVLEAVPVRRGVGADRIARIARLGPDVVVEALAALHTAGLVERSEGPAGDRWRLVRDEEPL